MGYQMAWAEFAEKRMKQVNVFNEVDCFKAIREIVNLYFSGDKDKVAEKMKEVVEPQEETNDSPLKGKIFGGWNVDYYCRPVDWDVFKR